MSGSAWSSSVQTTIPESFERRLSDGPDGEYVDMTGAKLSARQVIRPAARWGAS